MFNKLIIGAAILLLSFSISAAEISQNVLFKPNFNARDGLMLRVENMSKKPTKLDKVDIYFSTDSQAANWNCHAEIPGITLAPAEANSILIASVATIDHCIAADHVAFREGPLQLSSQAPVGSNVARTQLMSRSLLLVPAFSGSREFPKQLLFKFSE